MQHLVGSGSTSVGNGPTLVGSGPTTVGSGPTPGGERADTCGERADTGWANIWWGEDRHRWRDCRHRWGDGRHRSILSPTRGRWGPPSLSIPLPSPPLTPKYTKAQQYPATVYYHSLIIVNQKKFYSSLIQNMIYKLIFQTLVPKTSKFV